MYLGVIPSMILISHYFKNGKGATKTVVQFWIFHINYESFLIVAHIIHSLLHD